jgi:Flp pilus assembly protein TadG
MKKKILFPTSPKGQSLVELAISLLFLIYLLSGAAEFGVLFFQYVQLRDAAQEGALYGSASFENKPPTSTELQAVETRARQASGIAPINLSDTSKVTVVLYVDNTLVWRNGVSQGSTSVACEGHGLRVVVSYTHQIFMPFMPQLLGRSTIPLSAEVTDTILTPVC